MKYKLLISCLLFSASLFAQSYTRSWRNCFGDDDAKTLSASATDGSDNLYVAGYLNLYSSHLQDSIYLRKYSPTGKLLWEARELFTATTAWNLDVPLTVAADRDGNVILAYSFSFVQSNLDAVVSKYNTAGKKLWQTVFDGPADPDNEQIRKLNIDSKGNICLLVAENYNYATVVTFNSKGRQLWYRDMKGIVIDDTPTDFQVKDATIDSAGNVYATGLSARLHNGLYHDALTYKFMANGDSAWRVRYGVNYTDHFPSKVMYAKGDNSVVLSGNKQGNDGDSVFAIKYTTAGKKKWIYMHQPAAFGLIEHSLVDADNNILLVTNFATEPSPPPVLTKLSSSGSVLWTKNAFTVTSPPEPLYFILDAKTDAQSNYYFVSNQNKGVLIQKFDKLGNLLTQLTEGIDSSVQVDYFGVKFVALHVGKSQSIYMPLTYTYNYIYSNSCLYKYTMKNTAAADAMYTTKTVPALSSNVADLVYPNPAHDLVHVRVPAAITSQYTIRVFDASGKQILTKQASGAQADVDIHALTPGLYILKVMGKTGEAAYRFVKQ